MEQGLLTQREIEIMMHHYITNYDKAMYLISELPRKGDEFFGKFMFCLSSSKAGTGHGDIIRCLTTSLNELKIAHSEEIVKVKCYSLVHCELYMICCRLNVPTQYY